MTIRTVHVGVRGRGAWPLHLMRADAEFEPVAIVTRDPATLEGAVEVAAHYPGAVFTDLDAALDAVDCDAVVVCTPVELHGRDHLYWPALDVDLELDSLDNPQRFPLVARSGPPVPGKAHKRTSTRGGPRKR